MNAEFGGENLLEGINFQDQLWDGKKLDFNPSKPVRHPL
jgi:hypothetical protein